MTFEHTSAITASSSELRRASTAKGNDFNGIRGVDDQSSGQQTIRQKTADAMDAARGPSFAADQDEGPQQGSGRPIPPLVSKIQVATTNAGARAEGGLTPDFLALSMSYGMTSKLLQDVLPIDQPINTFTIRQHVADVAERLEQELGDEQFCFVEGCQRSWDELPSPDGPLTVGIDGGYVRGQHKQGQFEVIAGKSLLAFKRDQEGKQQLSARCFAWVQTYDEKPKRRLFELLQSQGMQPNQQVDFLSDGGEDVRNVQLYLNPQAEHLLDWFHLTMRLTVLNQTAKGLPERIGEGEDQYELRPGVLKDLERIKWYLWHGNVFQALNELQSLEMDLDAAAFESKDENARKLLKGVEELHTYVERNQEFVPNYGERYRNGEKIASGFVESAINQVVSKRMVKKQQMGWSQHGAHLLLQIRTRVLDEEWENTFRRWYPDFRPQGQAKKAA